MPLDRALLEREARPNAAPHERTVADGRGTVALRWDHGEKRPAVTLHLDGALVAAERFDPLNAKHRATFAALAGEPFRSEVLAALLELAAAPRPSREGADDAPPAVVLVSHAEPWPESVHLADCLDAARAALRQHAVLPPHGDVAVTLWCALTHFLESVSYFGILHVMSPTRESGKTRLLELAHLMSARAWSLVHPTLPSLFRVIAAEAPTIVLDEADTLRRETVSDFTALLNDGVRRGGCIPRVSEQPDGTFAVEGFAIYCPKAVGSIGVPFGDATVSRTIRVEMQRARPDELRQLAPFRMDHAERQWAHDLRRRLTRAAADDGPRLAAVLEHAADDTAAVPLPPGVDGRQAQVWEPLVALADVAGGDWPALARAACSHFVGALEAAEPADPQVRLLADLRTYFTEERPTARYATSEQLLEYLTGDESRGWREYRNGHPLTPHGLARLLKPFGLAPAIERAAELPNGRARAWARAKLEPVWDRLAPPESRESTHRPGSVTSVQPVPSVPLAVTDATLVTLSTLSGTVVTTLMPAAATGLEVLPAEYWASATPGRPDLDDDAPPPPDHDAALGGHPDSRAADAVPPGLLVPDAHYWQSLLTP
jgi:hypothetical protein